ncbi:winged helix-turn-helix transcriptional regulator [Paenibacillus harenae]|uniref:DNA-binding HxlR family transcriptional regulator n=1 Tax=Paenibacillus harenae TaxID=306543 RepID=A0ABT9U4P9_PAEHA|nr:helix-turn-helix domain-containing protein [Paenibacillus harenae]MDQ0062544.1 DNA-binding HxlR family transcriptional regulator [Paenibacillus harenae]MDQ0114543.1 DNA-binding HxlR family transcriptional regulator [Paenibacillus harenae]
MKTSDISLSICSYTHVLEIISNKWTALVIYALEDGTIRYGEIKRRIEGISQKMLTQTLKQLERDGLVSRKVTPTVPPVVEYTLTPLGESLIPQLRMLKEWARTNYPQVKISREEYDIREEK